MTVHEIRQQEGKEYIPKRVKKMTPLCYAKMIKALQENDYDYHELAELTGLHVNTIGEYMRCLHREGAVHVCDWHKDKLGRDTTPVFRMGEGRDKKRHKLSDVQKSARHRAKKKAVAMNNILKIAA